MRYECGPDGGSNGKEWLAWVEGIAGKGRKKEQNGDGKRFTF